MYVVTVLPITRGIGKEELSYLVSKTVSVGDLLFVPIRKKTVPSIVVAVRDGKLLKTELKQARFRLRLIREPKTVPFFDPRFLEAAIMLARSFVGYTGEVLRILTPAPVLKNAGLGKYPLPSPMITKGAPQTHYALQAPLQERLALYKNTIRETFAHGRSVYVCVQTLGDIERISKTLTRGLEPYVIIFHGTLSEKEQQTRWQKALEIDHPILVIGTPHFLSLPRGDFGAYIEEGGEWRGRKSQERPFLDYGVVLMTVARAMDALLLLGDTMLSLTTQYAITKGDLLAHAGSRQRIDLSIEPNIVHVRTKSGSTKTPFEERLISDELLDILTQNGKQGKQSFLFANRKGIAPITICGDCGAMVLCPTCKAPRLLRSLGKKHVFFCARCDEATSAEVFCSRCESWKLVPLGIGAERVFESVKTLFPDRAVFLLTRDSVSSAKEAEKLREQFWEIKDSILVGTEMALHYLREPIPLVAAVSLDALFAVPDYRMHERMYGLLVSLAEHASEHCVIQTRRPKEKLWEELKEMRSTSIYRNELREREAFSYPPISVLIKVRWVGKSDKSILAETYLQKILSPFSPTFFEGESRNGEKKIIALLRIPRDAWSFTETQFRKPMEGVDYSNLRNLLFSLPRDFVVDVNPDDLLS